MGRHGFIAKTMLPLHAIEILVLEDEPLWRREIVSILEEQGAAVMEASCLAEARRCLEAQSFDFALLDINLPDGSSLELLRQGTVETAWGVVVMTAEGGVETAVEAMRLGAGDYLSKPFDPEELPLVLGRLRKQRQTERIGKHERERIAKEGGDFFFGQRLEGLRKTLDRILQTDAQLGSHLPPILLQGETGTGKSSLARWIHGEGPRAQQPFLEINCAALPENLAESELFGYEKGAFTDARTDRIGLFEAAQGGTLFLDEIGSLSPAVQAKILTAVENREIRRVGGRKSISVEVRLIAASLESLPKAVEAKQFREDLYHRLNLLSLTLPPLREHPMDIPPIAEFLLGRLNRRYRRSGTRISPSGMNRLQTAPWPGNVRELSHEIERALILGGDGALDFEHLTTPVQASGNPDALLNPRWQLPNEGFALESSLRDMERIIIAQALDRTGGNQSAAARLLGVPRDYLRYRVRPDASE